MCVRVFVLFRVFSTGFRYAEVGRGVYVGLTGLSCQVVTTDGFCGRTALPPTPTSMFSFFFGGGGDGGVGVEDGQDLQSGHPWNSQPKHLQRTAEESGSHG